jgi:hypothetical protein
MAKRWITGWKVDQVDRTRLLALFPPLFSTVISDHVTLRSGTSDKTPLPTQQAGEIVGEIDDARGVQALIVSIGGTTTREDGSTYHITWSLDRAAGRRAVESNAVISELGWRPLPEPVPVRLSPARF